LSGCRESELGDSELGTVLESLVPLSERCRALYLFPLTGGDQYYLRPDPDGGVGSSRSLGGTQLKNIPGQRVWVGNLPYKD
jgi:hypothetical protein